MSFLDVTKLIDGYNVALQLYPHPIVAVSVNSGKEKLILALMHPQAYLRIQQDLPEDPRNTTTVDDEGNVVDILDEDEK